MRDSRSVLPVSAYRGPAWKVAPRLLGQLIQRGPVVLRVVEVEAYGGPEDSASHARFGRTVRNRPMWGPPGHAYVYLCYGIHWMLNIVTTELDIAGAVLIRACELVEGAEQVKARRGDRTGRDLLGGPGRVAQALGLDGSWSGHRLDEPTGPLALRRGWPPDAMLRGPRVGIAFAQRRDRGRRWRFADKDSPFVSRPGLA